MDKEYWEEYYLKNSKPFNPSDFSKFVIKHTFKNASIIDLGCGNGRDSIYLSKFHRLTVGVDQSKNIIRNLKKYETENLLFENSDFVKLRNNKFDFAYCRFIFHSISETEEDNLLHWLKKNIVNKIFIEARINLDSNLYVQTNHYRRLMNIEEFKSKLELLNLKITYEKISNKFSIYNKNYNVEDVKFNPQLVRFVISNR